MPKKFYKVLPFVVARIENEEGEILLGQEPELPRKPYPGYWGFPGGKLEPNETIEDCIIREIKEETGFEVENMGLFEVFHFQNKDPNCTNGVKSVGICYKVEVSGKFKPTEMENMQWLSPKEIQNLENLVPWARKFLQDILER